MIVVNFGIAANKLLQWVLRPCECGLDNTHVSFAIAHAIQVS